MSNTNTIAAAAHIANVRDAIASGQVSAQDLADYQVHLEMGLSLVSIVSEDDAEAAVAMEGSVLFTQLAQMRA